MRFTHIQNIGGEHYPERVKKNGVVCPAGIRGGGNITIAYTHDQDKDFEGPRTITAAFAFCNPGDQFRKDAGRGIAQKKYEKGKTSTVSVLDVSDFPNSKGPIVESVLSFLLESTDPMTLIKRQDYDDSLIAPRWVQQDIVNQFAAEFMHQYEGGCCDEDGCDCEETE